MLFEVHTQSERFLVASILMSSPRPSLRIYNSTRVLIAPGGRIVEPEVVVIKATTFATTAARRAIGPASADPKSRRMVETKEPASLPEEGTSEPLLCPVQVRQRRPTGVAFHQPQGDLKP